MCGMQVHIRSLNPDDERDVEAAYQILAAANAHDVPDFPPWSRNDHVGRLRYDWPGSKGHHWLAFVGETAMAALGIDLPYLDNTHLASVELVVHPDNRRRGIGRALYTWASDFARANGRSVLQGEYVTQLPGGVERNPAHGAFREAMGAKAALPEIRRRLDLDTVDRSVWTELLAQARTHARGYSVVAWTDAAPEDIVAELARLDSRFLIDAPMGDLILEPEKVDVARIRATEEMIRLRRRRSYHVGARHDDSGDLAGWTMIAFDHDTPSHAWQQVTIVDPAHRGHRLGLLVKIENLLHTLAHEPALRHLDTWNATENAHMVAINEAIGFRPVDGWISWQAEI